MNSVITPLSDISLDEKSYGYKGLVLAELYQKGAEIHPGYIVSSLVFKQFLSHNQLNLTIKKILHSLNTTNLEQLTQVSHKIGKLILQAELSPEINQQLAQITTEIALQYPAVSLFLSVPRRISSNQAWEVYQEIVPLTSANHLETQLKLAWSYAFSPAILQQTDTANPLHLANQVGVILLPVADYEITVNAFSRNPVTQDATEQWLEAIWGQWQPELRHQLSPDTYLVDEIAHQVKKISLQPQTTHIRLTETGFKELTVSPLMSKSRKLTDALVEQISEQVRMIKKHYHNHIRLQYGYLGGKLYITNLSLLKLNTAQKAQPTSEPLPWSTHKPALIGISAYPGRATGRVLYIKSARDYQKIRSHHIVFCKRPLLPLTEYLSKAAGIVSTQFGQVSETAILGRVLKKPTIIGCADLFKTISQNQVVTVDAQHGLLYRGKVDLLPVRPVAQSDESIGIEIHNRLILPGLKHVTITGDVLVDSDSFYREYLPKHPSFVTPKIFTQLIQRQLLEINHSFFTNTLIYQAHRLRHQDFLKLKQGKAGERLLKLTHTSGLGLKRYLEDETSFEKELTALADYLQAYPETQFVYSLPNIINVADFDTANGIISRHLPRTPRYIYLDSVHTMFILEELFDRGVSGIVVDLEKFLESYFETPVKDLELKQLSQPQDHTGLLKAFTIICNMAKRHSEATVALRLGSIRMSAKTLTEIKACGFTQLITLPERYLHTQTILAGK